MPKVDANEVRELIADQLDVDVEDVTDDKNIVEDLNADSLDVVELVIKLEEKFEIHIPEEDAEKLVTVKDVIDYLTASR